MKDIQELAKSRQRRVNVMIDFAMEYYEKRKRMDNRAARKVAQMTDRMARERLEELESL